ncbi:AraC family transcriptional regulator [Ectothiorhodospiraceae bacterium WFHF3C12]|nr:AraC family transcriptional regulator [Ectothiorhodospiraceae bacterium WFHF3C12]
MSANHDSEFVPVVRSSAAITDQFSADPLSDALETVRLRAAVFFFWEPSWPFTTAVPSGARFGPLILPGAGRIVSYHIVTRGPCWGAVAGAEPMRLDTGDILLVPHGDPYVMSNDPVPPPGKEDPSALAFFRMMAAGELPARVVDGGPGPGSNSLVCGFLGCDGRPFNPVLAALPRLVRIPASAASEHDPLGGLVDFAVRESHSDQGGGRCVLLRLAEMMFVEVLRRYLATAPADAKGWLASLRDPLVGCALRLLHGSPAAAWTLDRLAREAGTSRTVLAERFSVLVGEPPMAYLTRWRMQLAARQLADGPCKVHAVARAVGYESEAAFSRAFKRTVGVAPSRWRPG